MKQEMNESQIKQLLREVMYYALRSDVIQGIERAIERLGDTESVILDVHIDDEFDKRHSISRGSTKKLDEAADHIKEAKRILLAQRDVVIKARENAYQRLITGTA